MNFLRRLSPINVRSAFVLSTALTFGFAGCKSTPDAPAPIIDNSGTRAANGADPAAVNMAPVSGGQQGLASVPKQQSTRVLGTSQSYAPQQTSQDYYPQQSAADDQAYDGNYQDYDATPVYADQAPPPLPVYSQPAAPEADYLWTPGYWDYANTGYYWVPGAWTAPPYRGALWTPGYWGRDANRYRYHHGYWGLHVGYYGGIDYGYGYVGSGYYGGYWNRDHFYYNRSVNNIRVNNNYVYERPVIVNNIRYTATPQNRVSYNGTGGVEYRPRPYEIAAMREQHTPPMQTQHEQRTQAAGNREQFFNNNHGQPAQAFSQRPVTASPGFVRPGGPGYVPSGGNTPQQPRALQEQQRQQEMQQHQQQAQQLQNQRVQNEQLHQQQRQELQNQRVQNGQLHQQQNQQLQNQRVQNDQLRQQQVQQHQQAEQQRQHQNEQLQNQRVQNEQQRQQQVQQQNTQQQQGRQQAEQQRQQREQVRQQQVQQRTADQGQFHHTQPQGAAPPPRVAPQTQQPRAVPQPAPQPRVEAPRPAPQPHVEAPRPAPQPHAEPPRPAAAAPHAEAPHAAPGPGAAPHAEGQHEGHPR